MSVAKNLHPTTAHHCTEEMESMVWVMILIIGGLIAAGIFLFMDKIGA